MTRRTPSFLGAIVVGVCMHASSSVVSAQVYPVGPTQEILTSDMLEGATSDVAYDPQKDIYLVVTDRVPSGSDFTGVWGVFVDSAGQRLRDPFPIYQTYDHYTRVDRPRVMYSAAFNNGPAAFYVTWRERDETLGWTSLWGRGVTYPDGLVRDGLLGIVRGYWSVRPADADPPLMAYSSTSRIGLLVWSVIPPPPAPPEIYARLLDPTGTTPRPWFVGNGVAGDLIWNPRMDEFAIAYRSADGGTARLVRLSAIGWGPSTTLRDVAVSRLPVPAGQVMETPMLALGEPIGCGVVAAPCRATNDEGVGSPTDLIGVSERGNYVMIWATGAPTQTSRTFYSAELDFLGNTIATGSIGTYAMRAPSISFNPTSRTFVVLDMCMSSSLSQEVCAVQLNQHGALISELVQVTSADRYLSTGEGPPRATAGPDERWLITFATATSTYVQSITTDVLHGGPGGPPR